MNRRRIIPDKPPGNEQLIAYLRDILAERTDSFLSCPPEPPAIRVNTLKCATDILRKKLDSWQVKYVPLFFNPDGFAIRHTPYPLSHKLEFFRGFFQMQGIASQLPALVLNPKPGERVLDMAAAPGSKSTQLAALMNNRGQLYLNDINRGRLQALNANIQRSGALNQIITCLPGERLGNLFPAFFDKILLDAPCTALGTLPGHPEVAAWWSYNKLAKLSALQHRLLISAVKALKVGGELVYSTCSLAPQENETVIQQMLDTYPLRVLTIETVPAERFDPGRQSFGAVSYSREMGKALRTDPLKHKTEGFFVVKLQKSATVFESPVEKRMKFTATIPADDPVISRDLQDLAQHWGIKKSVFEHFRYIRTRNRLWMVQPEIEQIPQTDFVSAGLLLAGKKLSGWRLTNQSLQVLDKNVSGRRVSLQRESFIQLFSEGRTKTDNLQSGYYALQWQDDAVAIIYVENGIARIRLPHRFRIEESLD